MEHHFNVQVAQRFGIEEAVIIHNLFHWISKNAANDESKFDGLYWTYNSIKAYSLLFPYMSETKVKRVFKFLEEEGAIVKGNFSDDKWCRTNWYSFTPDMLSYLGSVGYDVHWVRTNSCIGSKCSNALGQNDQMKLINYTDSKQQIVNKEEDTNVSPKKVELFEKCWEAYGRKGSKKNALEQWKKLSSNDTVAIERHIPFYIRSNDFRFLKDFERYLKHRMFESKVVDKNGIVLYDPERDISNKGYAPMCGGALMYNDYYQCFMYTGYWDGHIADGYTDDSRPDGAEVRLNNGRGTVVWSRELKNWRKK